MFVHGEDAKMEFLKEKVEKVRFPTIALLLLDIQHCLQ